MGWQHLYRSDGGGGGGFLIFDHHTLHRTQPMGVLLREWPHVHFSTGCQWRAIPKDLPPKSTIYDYFDALDRIVPAIHVCRVGKSSMPGTRPGMMKESRCGRIIDLGSSPSARRHWWSRGILVGGIAVLRPGRPDGKKDGIVAVADGARK